MVGGELLANARSRLLSHTSAHTGTGAYIGATGTWSLVEAEGLSGVQTDIATHTIVVNVTNVASY